MLHKNDIFTYGAQRLRLLCADLEHGWVMPLGGTGWPFQLPWDFLKRIDADEQAANPADPLAEKLKAPTEAMKAAGEKARALLGHLPDMMPAIFEPSQRQSLIRERAKQVGCSEKTLWKHLRRWWEGGQTDAALLGQFHRSGRPGETLTNKRGLKIQNKYMPYQLTSLDTDVMRELITGHYLRDARTSIASTFQHLLNRHYRFDDGNGNSAIRPPGERPSLRQFEHFLRSKYTLEVRLRKRKGNKDFEREDRGVLGTVLDECAGVGHYYEADATIADVYLVAEHSVDKIIGKPTLYFIIDRKSRLIVGWYVGLENPSWTCALQALLSISEDKQAMCARHNVAYDPEDWPAHQIFPQQVLADRGEMFTKSASQLAEYLHVTVTNVPAKRGDWKPVVESGFKQTRMLLQDGTPGFDPPENARRRQGKRYEKDACLTLREFSKIILLAIIKHNRTAMRSYMLSPQEMLSNVRPSPIGIWNHNIVDRAGVLPRYTEETVRFALLPRGEATLTEHGILFNGCYYSCQAAVTGGWFTQARRRRTKLTVSYDGRLVDSILVHDPAKPGATLLATLLPRSKDYIGLSFAEVSVYERMRAAMRQEHAQDRIQTTADFNDAAAQVTAAALERLKQAGRKVSRTARKADTKHARQAELRAERQDTASMHVAQRDEPAQVISFPTAAVRATPPSDLAPEPTSLQASVPGSIEPSEEQLSMAQRLRNAREKMMMESE